MPVDTLTDLLKLPVADRADLAIALWESLDEAHREAERALTSEQISEIDRRLADHIADPGSAIPWEDVRRDLVEKP